MKAKVAAGKAWVKGKAEAGKEWVKSRAAAVRSKIKDRFTGRDKKPVTGAGSPSPESQSAAIADADQMLKRHPNPTAARQQLPDISKKHGVPLHLVVESHSAIGDKVHVQTMATDSYTLTGYDPTTLTEAQLWEHADRDFKLPDETAEVRAQRASAARRELAQRIGGALANETLVGHFSTRSPRATRGSSGEDSAGRHAGHINARHVLGQTREDAAPPPFGTLVTHDWLAYRAAVNTPPCGGMSGAFADPGAAGAAIQAAATEVMSDWTAFRMSFLRTGRVQTTVSAVPSGSCYIRFGPVLTAAQLPVWAGGTGTRRLHATDTQAPDDPPLVDSGAPSGTEIRILASEAAPNGWFVHSAWPVI